MSHDQAWALGLAGFVSLELYLRELNNESTLSCATRRFFRVHTPAGKVAFGAAYVAFSLWYVPHIVKRLDPGRIVKT